MESLFSEQLRQKLGHAQEQRRLDFPFRLDRQWGVGYVQDSYSVLLIDQQGRPQEVHLPLLAFHRHSVKLVRLMTQLVCVVVGPQGVYVQTVFCANRNQGGTHLELPLQKGEHLVALSQDYYQTDQVVMVAASTSHKRVLLLQLHLEIDSGMGVEVEVEVRQLQGRMGLGRGLSMLRSYFMGEHSDGSIPQVMLQVDNLWDDRHMVDHLTIVVNSGFRLETHQVRVDKRECLDLSQAGTWCLSYRQQVVSYIQDYCQDASHLVIHDAVLRLKRDYQRVYVLVEYQMITDRADKKCFSIIKLKMNQQDGTHLEVKEKDVLQVVVRKEQLFAGQLYYYQDDIYGLIKNRMEPQQPWEQMESTVKVNKVFKVTRGEVQVMADLGSDSLLGYGSYGTDIVSIVAVTQNQYRVVDQQQHRRQQVERVQNRGYQVDMQDGQQLSTVLMQLSEETNRSWEDKAEQTAWLAQQYCSSIRQTVLSIAQELYGSSERNQYIALSYDRLSDSSTCWQTGQVSLIVHQLQTKKERLLKWMSYVHRSALRSYLSSQDIVDMFSYVERLGCLLAIRHLQVEAIQKGSPGLICQLVAQVVQHHNQQYNNDQFYTDAHNLEPFYALLSTHSSPECLELVQAFYRQLEEVRAHMIYQEYTQDQQWHQQWNAGIITHLINILKKVEPTQQSCLQSLCRSIVMDIVQYHKRDLYQDRYETQLQGVFGLLVEQAMQLYGYQVAKELCLYDIMCQLYVQSQAIPESYILDLMREKDVLAILLDKQMEHERQARPGRLRLRIFKELGCYHNQLLQLCHQKYRKASWNLAIKKQDYPKAIESLLENIGSHNQVTDKHLYLQTCLMCMQIGSIEMDHRREWLQQLAMIVGIQQKSGMNQFQGQVEHLMARMDIGLVDKAQVLLCGVQLARAGEGGVTLDLSQVGVMFGTLMDQMVVHDMAQYSQLRKLQEQGRDTKADYYKLVTIREQATLSSLRKVIGHEQEIVLKANSRECGEVDQAVAAIMGQ